MNESIGNESTRAGSAEMSRMATPPSTSQPDSVSDVDRERLHQLALELRCLVCQNQSIADSNSGLAIDLRNQIASQIKSGQSDAEIKQYMVERYGDFVLYKPPYSMENAVLWLGPFLLLAIGAVIAWRSVAGRRRAAQKLSDAPNADATQKVDSRQELEARYRQDAGL